MKGSVKEFEGKWAVWRYRRKYGAGKTTTAFEFLKRKVATQRGREIWWKGVEKGIEIFLQHVLDFQKGPEQSSTTIVAYECSRDRLVYIKQKIKD